MGPCVVVQLKRQLVLWGKQEPFVNVIDGPVEILPLVFRSVVVVLAIHHVEVLDEPILDEVLQVLLLGSRGNRRPLFPVKLRLLVKEGEIPLTVRRCLVDVLELIGVLLPSTVLVKELLVLSVVRGVIFGKCDMGSVVPRRHVFVCRGSTLSGAQLRKLSVMVGEHGLLRYLMHSTIGMRIQILLLMREFSFVRLFHYYKLV